VAWAQDLPAGWEEPVATGKLVQAGESIYPLGQPISARLLYLVIPQPVEKVARVA